MRQFGLSKSKLALFEQCPKRLWLSVHRPGDAVIDAATQAKFDAGHQVGVLACEAYADGIMIEAIPDIDAALRRTAELLELDPPRPIFEATFCREGVLVRVDLMVPAGEGQWHVAEVKSSTSAKPYQISDLATQIWVLIGCGVRVASASIRHLDGSFIYQGDGNFSGLLKDQQLDEAIATLIATRSEMARDALATLQGAEPVRETGDHCSAPFTCSFLNYCNRDKATVEWPIHFLPGRAGKTLAKKLGDLGIVELSEMEEQELSNKMHQRIHRASMTGKPYHDSEGARKVFDGWPGPLAYLDFETVASAIPHWRGTRPYEAIPFQFSAHIEQADGTIVHRQFIDLSGNDPRRGCAEALVNALPRNGAIIAYNASFEVARIRELAAQCPDLASHLLSIAGRVVDLLPVTRAHYYHRDQRGSWSIKSVLPTIAPELSYAGLDVGDGGAAQVAFSEAVNPATTPERRRQIENALLRYCELDTWAMVIIKSRLAAVEDPIRPKLSAFRSLASARPTPIALV